MSSEEKKDTNQEPIDYRSMLIEPHDVKSRKATEADIPRIIEDAKKLYNLCFTQYDRYAGALAMAHPQITKDDPLRLFVLANKEIVINPEIITHTRHPVDSKEGCITFYHLPQKVVQRYHRIQVAYQTLTPDANGFTELRTIDLSGKDSFVFQHEIDHLDGKYIWEMEYAREKMLAEARKLNPELFPEGSTGAPAAFVSDDVKIDTVENKDLK